MWTEAVNQHNIIARVWPRASAVAEKLWSAQEVNDTQGAKPRLEEHACRMNHRGIAAQPPNGPGVCL
jgi:hexosaminidase